MIQNFGLVVMSLIYLTLSGVAFTLAGYASDPIVSTSIKIQIPLTLNLHPESDPIQFQFSISDLGASQPESSKRTNESMVADLLVSHAPNRTRHLTARDCKDINSANPSDLLRVKGIGRTKALSIIAHRNQHGPFQSLDELVNVKGIGAATVEIFRKADFCVLEKEEPENDHPSDQHNTLRPQPIDADCKDINSANAKDLQQVNTIGAVKAQAIVDYRSQNGAFQSMNELTNIRGIGSATLEKFREARFCVVDQTNTNGDSEATNESSPPKNNDCDDINVANASMLQRVRGIGPAKAQNIIEFREQHGPFQSLDDLIQVKGIAATTLEFFRSANFCIHAFYDTDETSEDQSSTASLAPLICENINSTNTATLERVNGMGPVRARSIIEHRHQHGPFLSMERLLDVHGIEEGMVADLQESGFCAEILTTDLSSILADTSWVPALSLPYQQNLYGGWLDVDEDCQNTRHEILISESLVDATLDESGCFVIGGQWHDPYLDTLITDPSIIDIDHFIPLAEAHRSGGAKWDDSTRYSFGNDLSKHGLLIPVFASINRSKGSQDPADWLPPNPRYHCQYIDRWVTLKTTWRLTMDYAEQEAVSDIRDMCMLSIEAK